MSENWYVSHFPWHPQRNNCSGDKTLQDCLQDVKSWSDANPTAEVLTVYLDKKQNWSSDDEGRTPEDLDALIDSIFPRDRLYIPADLKGGFSTVREAAKNDNWSSVDELRGKIIFVLTGGGRILYALGNHNATQNKYIESRGDSARLFVALDLDDANDYSGTPEGYNAMSAGYVVFYNQKDENFNQTWTNEIRARNYVTRFWWSGESDDGRDFCDLVNKGITHPAFYEYWDTNFIQQVNLIDPKNPCRLI